MFPPPDPIGENAAVLLNETGQPIITFTYIWGMRITSGEVKPAIHGNLGSSGQMEALAGRVHAMDRFSFILPGSKRLLTLNGTFGDNADVLPPDERKGGGVVASRAGGAGIRPDSPPVSLRLDFAILLDGLCIGPDTLGAFEAIPQQLEEQRHLAREIAGNLRAGATRGQIFDRLREFVDPPPVAPPAHAFRPRIVSMFAQSMIHHLIRTPDEPLLAQLDAQGANDGLKLRRPENQ